MTQVQEAVMRHQCGQELRDHLQHRRHQKELLKQQGFSGQRKRKMKTQKVEMYPKLFVYFAGELHFVQEKY